MGAHPHPDAGLERLDDSESASTAVQELLRETRRLRSSWIGSEHAMQDARVIEGNCEWMLRRAELTDVCLLSDAVAVFEDLARLRDVACCSSPDRARSAISVLRALAPHFRHDFEMLSRPSRAMLVCAAARLDAGARWLDGYTADWSEICEDTRSLMDAACRVAASELRVISAGLRALSASSAHLMVGVGREVLDFKLKWIHVLPYNSDDVMQRLQERAGMLEPVLGMLEEQASEGRYPVSRSDRSWIALLREQSVRWGLDATADAGLVVTSRKHPSMADGFGSVYLGSSALVPSGPSALYLEERCHAGFPVD
ncbi:MAG: hypothetical protein KDA21_15570, partial [Phycisphaerales bacterium]|nr:hypothetical protein [Phycisphaerales bacterium]